MSFARCIERLREAAGAAEAESGIDGADWRETHSEGTLSRNVTGGGSTNDLDESLLSFHFMNAKATTPPIAAPTATLTTVDFCDMAKEKGRGERKPRLSTCVAPL